MEALRHFLYGNAAGDGVACGESFIAADKACLVGGGDIAKAHDEYLRKQRDQWNKEFEWHKSVTPSTTADDMWRVKLPQDFAPKNAMRYVETAWPQVRATFKTQKAFKEAFHAAMAGGSIKATRRGNFQVNYGGGWGGKTAPGGGLLSRPIGFDFLSRESVDNWAAELTKATANSSDNCGTGAGGFQPGNTCGRGGGTDTPEFKAWFGQSKVVDADGKPRVMYHVTGANFSIFRDTRPIFVAFDERGASMAALGSGKTMRLYVRAERPANTQATPVHFLDTAKTLRDHPEADSVFVEDEAGVSLAVRESSQLKSAARNTGKYSKTDRSIFNSLANAEGDFLSKPVPFKEAVKYVTDKHLLPTTLSSEELMGLDAAVRERAMFSARTANAWYLQRMKTVIDHVVGPWDAGGKPWTGVNAGSARAQLKDALRSIGYAPAPGDKGTIKDLSSDQRLNLIVSTQTDMAHGFGQRAQSMTPVAQRMWAAFELYRAEERNEPRDWPARWAAAGGQFFEGKSDYAEGRMVALKTDPIWEEINAFGLPYPPFDFGSGMDLRQVSRRECIELGLIDDDWAPEAAEEPLDPDDFAAGTEASAEQFDPEVLEALVQSLGAGYHVAKGVLSLLNEALANADNCGTGAGGFQPGNTCGRGGGGRTDTPEFKAWFGESKVVNSDGEPLRVFHGGSSGVGVAGFSAGSGRGVGLAYFSDDPNVASKYALGGGIKSGEGVKDYQERLEAAREEGRLSKRVPSVVPAYLSIQNPLTDQTSVQDLFQGDRGSAETVLYDWSPVFRDKMLDREQFDGPIQDHEWWDAAEAEVTAPEAWAAEDTEAIPAKMRGMASLVGNHRQKFPHVDGLVYQDQEAGGTTYVVFDPAQVKSVFNRGTWSKDEEDISNEMAEAEAIVADIFSQTNRALCAK